MKGESVSLPLALSRGSAHSRPIPYVVVRHVYQISRRFSTVNITIFLGNTISSPDIAYPAMKGQVSFVKLGNMLTACYLYGTAFVALTSRAPSDSLPHHEFKQVIGHKCNSI